MKTQTPSELPKFRLYMRDRHQASILGYERGRYKLDLMVHKPAEDNLTRRQSHHDQHARLLEEVETRQRNVLWPDTVLNASSVDALLWKGSPKATRVQRVGIAIWGLSFLALGGFFTVVEARELHSPIIAVLGLLLLALGARVTLNAFRRQPRLTSPKKR